VLGSVAHTIVDLRLVRAALDALPWTVDRVVVAPEAGRLVVSCRHWQFVVAAYVPPDGTHIEPLLARTPAPAPTEERLLRRKDEPSRKSEKRLYGFNAWPSKTRNRVSSRQEAAHEGDVPETRAREEDT